MTLYALNSELDKFWYNQYLKLTANDGFLDKKGSIYDDVLHFKHPSGVTALDFSAFELSHIQLEHAATLTLNGQHYLLSLKDYAKLTVANNITPKSVRSALPVYKFLLHLGAFLNANNRSFLAYDNLEEFHCSYMTQSVSNYGLSTRLSPDSYRGSYARFDFIKSRNGLQALGVKGFLDDGLTKKNIESTLDSACQTIMGLRLSEFKEGGSYNFLGLEMGQYYVDYMKTVYEADYFYALVCYKAMSTVSMQFQLNAVEESSAKNRWNRVLLDTIQGTFVANKHEKTSMPITRGKLHSAMGGELLKYYKVYFEKIQSLRECNIHSVIQDLGLTMRFDAVEIIRTLMLQKHYPFDAHKSAALVWESYLSSLDKTDIVSKRLRGVSVDDVYSVMSNTITKQTLGNTAFMQSLKQWAVALMGGQQKSINNLTSEIDRVTAAMTCIMVAWLGYRKSEFGFPFSAIHAEPNLDILDNSHVPFRFKLKWHVPKTNGKVKLDREITSQCYQVAAQLYDLFEPSDGAPCMYKSGGKRKSQPTSNKSAMYIESRVKSNWFSFIEKYQPFNEVNELKSLAGREVAILTKTEQAQLEFLSQRYDLSSARALKLIETSTELKRDIERLKCTGFAGFPSQARFKGSLVEFNQTGCISNSKHNSVVEQYLSDETKDWLLSNEANLDLKAMSDIGRELLQGVRYPSSHAFRHIWAEAVLTRYQGDVGAVIRHQFCHLDDSFFMAYLRDKEPRELVKSARMKVLNSIVDILLIESERIGQEYLGGFARYVKKAVQMTNAVSENEQLELRERIAQRVISVQPSHFATCIPREGGGARAKCAEFGDINPQNAKPEFCLNCTNALITGKNLKGIWLTLHPFVKESLSERGMGFMVAHHLPTLRSGYKRIKELRTKDNAPSVDKILNAIAEAINTIEEKLKVEGVNYG